jgi:hypothetical protein
MIGPHEGRELELMLKGRKPMAFFHDVLTEYGISEEIIPEKKFLPYLSAGKLIRLSADIGDIKSGKLIRCVCFAMPGEEWRARFLLWFKTEFFSRRMQYHPSHDVMIGKLLGYSDEDIQDFISSR